MMQCTLSILDHHEEIVCEHSFTMAGSNLERPVHYACKTLRRRWVRVEWFAKMNVWVNSQHIATITVDSNPILDIRRIP